MTQPSPDEAKAIDEALRGQRPAIVCYAQCESCQWGMCYDDPTPHPWAGPDDIEHARETGQPEPTEVCACPCAHPAADTPPPAPARHPYTHADTSTPDDPPVTDIHPEGKYL